MNFTKLVSVFCFVSIIGCFNPAHSDISEARDVVFTTINNIYDDISLEYDSDDELRASVEQSVNQNLTPVLDFKRFTKLILAKHWRKASIEQRQQFTGILQAYLFRTLTKAIVEHKQVLESYRDKLKVLDARPGRNEDRASVTVVVDTGAERSVELTFRLGREDEQWKAYDVVVQDISFAINYRAILNSEIKKHGIEKVAATFAEKLEE